MLMQIAGCACNSDELGALPDALTADKWNVQRGSRYRAVFQFNMFDAGEAWNALQDLGFTEIKIYDSASSLPSDWPVHDDDPAKDATPTLDTIIVRGELLWPKNDASINRRIRLSNDTAIVLKAWRWGGTPDPNPNPKPDPNPDPTPPAPEPTPPAPAPSSDPIDTAAKVVVGAVVGVLLIGGVVWVALSRGAK